MHRKRGRDLQQARVVQHVNETVYDCELGRRDAKPEVECLDELATNLFTFHGQDVCIGLEQNLTTDVREPRTDDSDMVWIDR